MKKLLNRSLIDEIKNKDYSAITNTIENFLQDKIKENNSKGLILGLSGGIDSAVLAYLCKRKLKDNTLAIIMPDTEITPKTETEDALKMIALTGIEYKLIDIRPIVYEYSKYLEPNDWAKGNLRARVRANILYYYANAKNYLVLGSSDKSEYLIGYFTKYGDGASDIVPIISLYKLQVRELARFLDVPKSVIEKKSSPHLWKDHIAEDEIGASYEEIDAILYCLYEKNLSTSETVNLTNIDEKIVEKIQQLYFKSTHKRNLQTNPLES